MADGKSLTIIGRDGQTTVIPNHSEAERKDMLRRSGVEGLIGQGRATDPFEMMAAMMRYQSMAGVKQYDAPPEELIREMSGETEGPAEDLDAASIELDPPAGSEDWDIDF